MAGETAGDFRLPGLSDRIAIVGATGSGKSQAGAWHLSRAPFDKIPYVIVDYKRERLFDQLEKVKEIGFGEVPRHPGLYLLQPTPADDEAVEEWLMKCWAREKIGFFIDEGYMLPGQTGGRGAFTYILTQGRSKQLPVIALSQRPVRVSRFVFSEATFFQIFRLTLADDVKTVQENIPKSDIDIMREQASGRPDYHSIYYDVVKRRVFRLEPVPKSSVILQQIEDRLAIKRRSI